MAPKFISSQDEFDCAATSKRSSLLAWTSAPFHLCTSSARLCRALRNDLVIDFSTAASSRTVPLKRQDGYAHGWTRWHSAAAAGALAADLTRQRRRHLFSDDVITRCRGHLHTLRASG